MQPAPSPNDGSSEASSSFIASYKFLGIANERRLVKVPKEAPLARHNPTNDVGGLATVYNGAERRRATPFRPSAAAEPAALNPADADDRFDLQAPLAVARRFVDALDARAFLAIDRAISGIYVTARYGSRL
jgi:hypothetical protein